MKLYVSYVHSGPEIGMWGFGCSSVTLVGTPILTWERVQAIAKDIELGREDGATVIIISWQKLDA